MRSRHADTAAATIALAAIAAIALILFASVLRRGDSAVLGPPHTDMAQQFYPLRAFVCAQASHGAIALWNPHLAGGVPLHAEGQTGLFYPVGMALSFLPAALGINLYAWLHLAGAGIALFLYLRAIRLSHAAAFLGALFFALSSVPVSRFYSGHYSMVPFIALAPALIWAWARWRSGRPAGALVAAALLYGAGILAAHPQSLYYLSIYLGWHMVFDTVADLVARPTGQSEGRPTARGILSRPIVFGAALAIGVGVGAVQLLPTLSFAARSFRHETTLAFSGVFSLAPENLVTFLAPGFFGDMLRGPYWGRNYLWEMWGYLGVVPLALALATILRPRSRNDWAHALAVPLFLVLALGRHSPLFTILYRWAPGFDLFRGTSKFVFFVVLSLAVLAARAVHRMTETERRDRTDTRAAIVAGAILLGGLVALLAFGTGPTEPGSLWRSLIAWRAAQGEDYSGLFQNGAANWPYAAQAWELTRWWLLRMLAFAAAGFALFLAWRPLRRLRPWLPLLLLGLVCVPDATLFARRYIVATNTDAIRIPPDLHASIPASGTPARALSFAATSGNALTADGIDTLQGYVGLLPARTNTWLTAAFGYDSSFDMASSPPPRTLSPLLLRANLQYLLMPSGQTLPPGFAQPQAEARGETLYRVANSQPRARFSQNVRPASSMTEARQMLLDAATTTSTLPDFIEGMSNPPDQLSTGTVHWTVREPNRIALETDAPGPGVLIVYESCEPGWRCMIDASTETAIHPANVAWRAVRVPAGHHTVEFTYRPPGFVAGAIVSALSLVTLLILGIARLLLSLRVRARSRGRDTSTAQ